MKKGTGKSAGPMISSQSIRNYLTGIMIVCGDDPAVCEGELTPPIEMVIG